MDNSLRFLAPNEHDRICMLFKKYPCEFPQLTTHLQVVKIFKVVSKYLELLDKIELFIIRNYGFNFIVKNIPSYAELRETSVVTRVGYEEMKDTLGQFGAVQHLEIYKGTVYVKFDNPDQCHRLINNMQMGQNIITTKIC